MYSPELQAKISLWRIKAAEGTITDDELRESVALLRGERKLSTESSNKRRTAKVKETKSADELLKGLGI